MRGEDLKETTYGWLAVGRDNAYRIFKACPKRGDCKWIGKDGDEGTIIPEGCLATNFADLSWDDEPISLINYESENRRGLIATLNAFIISEGY